MQSLKDDSVLLQYIDCVSRSSASQHTKNKEGNWCDLLARRLNCLSKCNSKSSIIKNYHALLLLNAGRLGKGEN